MKKVGKEFRKSLSAILAAAMVVSSMPETSLVANAEEVDAKQQSYELGDEIVDNGESITSTSVTLPTSNVSTGAALTISNDTTATVDADTNTISVTLGTVTESGNNVKSYYDFAIKSVKINGRTYTNGINGLTFTNDVVNYDVPEATAEIELQATLKDGYTYVADKEALASFETFKDDKSVASAFDGVKYFVAKSANAVDTDNAAEFPMYVKSDEDIYVKFTPAAGYKSLYINGYKTTLNKDGLYVLDKDENTIVLKAYTIDFGNNVDVETSIYNVNTNITAVTGDSIASSYYIDDITKDVKFQLKVKSGDKKDITKVEGNGTIGELKANSDGIYTVSATSVENAIERPIKITTELTDKIAVDIPVIDVEIGEVSGCSLYYYVGTSRPAVDDKNWLEVTANGEIKELGSAKGTSGDVTAGKTLYLKTVSDRADHKLNVFSYDYTITGDKADNKKGKEDGADYVAGQKDVWYLDIPLEAGKTVNISSLSVSSADYVNVTYEETDDKFAVSVSSDPETGFKTVKADSTYNVLDDRDLYIKVTGAKLVDTVKLGSTPATKYSADVYKIAGNSVAAGAITVDALTTKDVVTVNVDTTSANLKKVYYSTDNTNWIVAGSTVSEALKDKDAQYIYFKVDFDTAKYMLSDEGVGAVVGDKKAELAEGYTYNAYNNNNVWKVPVNKLKTGSTTEYVAADAQTISFTTEAKAYDYTITPSKDWTAQIFEGSLLKVKVGNSDWNTQDTVVIDDSYISSTETPDITLRIAAGKDVKISVAATDADKKIGTLTVDGADILGTLIESDIYKVGNAKGYYTFKSSAAGKIAVAATEKTVNAVKFKLDDKSETNSVKSITVYNDKTTGKSVVESEKANKLTTISTTGSTANVYPGHDMYFAVETADNYVVDYIEWSIGGKKYRTTSDTYTLAALDEATTLTVHTKENPAKLNTVNINYASKEAKVTGDAGTKIYEDGKSTNPIIGYTQLPASSASANKLAFTVEPKSGFEITSITVDGEELLAANEKIATGTKTVTVDFGTAKDSDGKDIAAYGITKNVVVTTVAAVNKNNAIFTFDTSAFGEYFDITVPSQAGISSYTRNRKTYYNVEAETTDEVLFNVEVKTGTKVDATSVLGTTAVIATGNKTEGEFTTYSFKINASLLTPLGEKETDAASKADVITLTPIPAEATITTESMVIYADIDTNIESDLDLASKLNGTKNNITVGTQYIILYKAYETLEVKTDDDENGNPAYITLSPDYVVNDGYYKGYNATVYTVTENATLKVSNKNLGAYAVSAVVGSQSNDAGKFEDEETGLLKGVTVKTGSTVTINVSKDSAFTLDTIEIAKDVKSSVSNVTTSVDGKTNTFKVVVDSADAGKTITIPLAEKDTSSSSTKITKIEDFVITVAPATTTATVTGIENGAKDVAVEAGKVFKYAMSYADATAAKLVTVTGATFESAASDNDTLVIDTRDLAVDKTKTVTITYGGKTVYSFTVKAVAPKLGITASSANAGDTYVNLTVVPTAESRDYYTQSPLYYEIKVTPATIAGSTAPTGSKAGYYYLLAGDYNQKTELFDFNTESFKIPVNTKGGKWTYDVDVRLVAASDYIGTGCNSITDAQASASNKIIAASDAAKTLTISTKDTYYEDNLSVKQLTKSAYSGQEIDLATLAYTGSTSAVSKVWWEIVDKKDGHVVQGLKREDVTSGVLTVKMPRRIKGDYVVNIYSESADTNIVNKVEEKQAMVQSKASLPIKIKAGINDIQIADTLKLTQVGKKDVTYTLKPVGYTRYNSEISKNNIKAGNKFAYEITSVANPANVGNVSVAKNGKIKVSKNFEFSSNENYNKFVVTITGADFDGNDTSKDVTVTVTKEAAVIASIALVDENGKDLGTNLTYDQTMYDIRGTGVEVVVKDDKGNPITDDVTLTPVKGSAFIEGNKLYTAYGKAPKSVTIKAVTKDGGKKSKTLKVKLGYNLDATLTGYVKTADSIIQNSNNDWSVNTNGGYFTFEVEADGTPARKDMFNWDIKVKGGKVQSIDGELATIQPKSEKITITLTDKTKKPVVKTTYTVNVKDYPSEKAPKFSLNKGEKLYANVGFVGTATQTLKYTVKSSDYDAVRVSYLSGSTNTLYAGIDNRVYDINEDGEFVLESFNTGTATGTVKYLLVFGTWGEKGFIPKTKAATLGVKVNKQTSVNIETNYTIDYNFTDKTPILVTGGSATNVINIVGVENDNVNGLPNNFATYFEVTPNNELALRSDYIKANKLIKAVSDIDAKDLTGYVKYQYLTRNGWVTKTEKVSVSLAKGTYSYKFAADPVVNQTNVYVSGYIVNSEDEVVAIASGTSNVTSATNGWTVSSATADGSGDIKVVLRTSAQAVGNNNITLNVIPTGSFLYKAGIAKQTIADCGVTATGAVTVLDATATGKLDIDKEKAVVDLGDEKTATQRYDSTKKTGFYKGTVKVEDIFKNVEGVEITTLSNSEKITGAKTTLANATVSYAATTGELSIELSEADATTVTSVPVTFSFNHSTGAETYDIAIKAPTVYDINGIKALVEEEIASYKYVAGTTTTTTVEGFVKDVTDKHKASGVSITGTTKITPVAVASGTPEEYTVTGKLVGPDGKTTVDFETTMSTKTVKKVETSIDEIVRIINTEILDESASTTGLTEGEYLVITPSVDKYTLKKFIDSRLAVYTTDSSKYITDVDITNVDDASNFQNGSITFKAVLFEADGTFVDETAEITKATRYTKYVAPTTP